MTVLIILMICACCFAGENNKLEDSTKTIIFVSTAIILALIVLLSLL